MVLIRIKQSLFIASCALLFALASPAQATSKPQYTLKFATLAPSGTTWMNILQEWGDEVKKQSNNRLIFKFYPGGVHGDEPDILKKMRFNQLQGGAFTGYGIGRMYSPARVLELPFMFDTVEEVDAVRHELMPEIIEGFHDNGYELLGWMEIVFIHMFSKKPISTLEDIRSTRVWLWQGDELGKAIFNASDISPVPLSIIDVYTSLSTGLIDTVYAPPLGAIALQWFTKTKYVNSIPLTNAIGGLVVSRRYFEKLPADLQTILRETGHEYGEKLVTATRADYQKSVDELKLRDLVFVEPGDDMQKEDLIKIRDIAAEILIESNYIPEAFFNKTRALLQQYRAQ